MLVVTRIVSQDRRAIKGARERGLNGEKAIVRGVHREPLALRHKLGCRLTDPYLARPVDE